MTKKERLTKLYEEGKEFLNKGLTSDNNKFIGWKSSLYRFAEQYYGKGSIVVNQLKKVYFSPAVYTDFDDDELFKNCFNDGMEEILEHLRRLIEEIEDYKQENENTKKKVSEQPTINVNVDASNTNINNNTILIYSSDEIKNNIQENTMLDDKSKEELLKVLKEIEELLISKESKSKKWGKGKKLLEFILDKGADIAIMYTPLIIQAISK